MFPFFFKKIDRKFFLGVFKCHLCLMKNNKEQYDVLSPDGFPIHFSNTYPTKESAMFAFNDWKKQFERQGYYSSNNGRIPLDELEQHCKIIKLD